MSDTPKERIAKRMARAGVCSRRDAEKLITAKKVRVNGEVITTPATLVGASDVIEVNGTPLPGTEAARLWRFHKPLGVLTAARDPEGRKTIYDILPSTLPRVMPVGRLDINTEGLLLLTNDGGLKRKLELPGNKFRRTYRVRVYGEVNARKLAGISRGVTIDEVRYGPIEVVREKAKDGKNQWLQMTISEGKNREIRHICTWLGVTVSRLIRISYGPYTLDALAPGAVEEVKI